MGLFDKAFKDMISKASETITKAKESEEFDAALKEAKNIFGSAKDALNDLAKKGGETLSSVTHAESATAEAPAPYVPYEEAGDSADPSGFSWGAVMPAEPNQYNYGGPWQEYFGSVFAECFPAYTVTRERTERGMIYTFLTGGRKALCVEVMDDRSEANSFRKKCRAEGTPYVRFYHNHDGWWNTKEYVYVRVREALEG